MYSRADWPWGENNGNETVALHPLVPSDVGLYDLQLNANKLDALTAGTYVASSTEASNTSQDNTIRYINVRSNADK